MCGRYALTSSQEALAALLGATPRAGLRPRYNIAPTQDVVVALIEDGERRFELFRWGLVPGFATDNKAAPLMFNARSETLAQKPAFRNALQRRRCLVPADCWYEWRTLGRFKQPYLVRRRDRAPLMFAGLWEVWRKPDGSSLRSVAIVTTPANDALVEIHERMPAVLPEAHWEAWLDTRVDGRSLALRCLGPAPAEDFETLPIGARVNQAGNEGPEVQEPAPVETPASAAQPRLL